MHPCGNWYPSTSPKQNDEKIIDTIGTNQHMFCVHSGTMCVGATTLQLNNLPEAHKNNITTPSS
jgi:hypothetical protein